MFGVCLNKRCIRRLQSRNLGAHENFTCSAFEAKLNELGERLLFFVFNMVSAVDFQPNTTLKNLVSPCKRG